MPLDRQIVYVGAIPLDTDQLLQSRNTMISFGYLAKMIVGDGACYADGLLCTPGNGLSVIIGPGSMTLPTVIDSSSYGALPPDSDPLVKHGINTSPITVSLPSTGESVISATVLEIQSGSSAVFYYNAENPSQTLVGVQGNGQAQATVVQQRVVFLATAPNAVPVGYIPLWQVTVPSSASAVDATMITMATGAPFVSVKLPQAAPLMSPAFTGAPTAPTATPGDTSSLLATTAFVGSATVRNRIAWGTGGTYSWTCPLGVSRILIRAWAAGGRGGDGSAGYPGGGGGGGGYEEVLIDVIGGTSYPVQIGNGISGSTSTSFGSQVAVGGGVNGQPGAAGQVGAGGKPGMPLVNNVSSVASLGIGTGQSGFQISNFNIGGGGGSSFGVQGAPACFGGVDGSPGSWPGGGGAGGATGAGGIGADGLMILEWNG